MTDHEHDQGDDRAAAERATTALRELTAGNRERLIRALVAMGRERPGYWLPRVMLAELTRPRTRRPGPLRETSETTPTPTAEHPDPAPAVTGHAVARVRGHGPVPVPPGEAAQRRATFGRVLAEARAAAGVSQAGLAQRAGVDRRHVERLEAGTRRPTAVMVWTLASALHPDDFRAALDLADRLSVLAAAPLAGKSPAAMARTLRRAAAATRAEAARSRVGDPPAVTRHLIEQ